MTLSKPCCGTGRLANTASGQSHKWWCGSMIGRSGSNMVSVGAALVMLISGTAHNSVHDFPSLAHQSWIAHNSICGHLDRPTPGSGPAACESQAPGIEGAARQAEDLFPSIGRGRAAVRPVSTGAAVP